MSHVERRSSSSSITRPWSTRSGNEIDLTVPDDDSHEATAPTTDPKKRKKESEA